MSPTNLMRQKTDWVHHIVIGIFLAITSHVHSSIEFSCSDSSPCSSDIALFSDLLSHASEQRGLTLILLKKTLEWTMLYNRLHTLRKLSIIFLPASGPRLTSKAGWSCVFSGTSVGSSSLLNDVCGTSLAVACSSSSSSIVDKDDRLTGVVEWCSFLSQRNKIYKAR